MVSAAGMYRDVLGAGTGTGTDQDQDWDRDRDRDLRSGPRCPPCRVRGSGREAGVPGRRSRAGRTWRTGAARRRSRPRAAGGCGARSGGGRDPAGSPGCAAARPGPWRAPSAARCHGNAQPHTGSGAGRSGLPAQPAASCPQPGPPGPAMAVTAKLKDLLNVRRDEAGELGRLLTASAKKVLLQKIEFEPASHGFSGQLELLRGKYLLLSPRTEPAEHPRGAEEGQPGEQGGCRGPGGSPCAAQPAAHPPLSPRRQRPDPGAPRGRRPCAPEGAVPCRAPRHAVAACPAHRRRAAQPGKHLFPQRHPAVPHVHATARQLPAVQGAQPHL